MKCIKIPLLLVVLLAGVFLTGIAGADEGPDYANPAHWLSLPVYTETEVDVFYLYPAVWRRDLPDEPDICRIDNPSMTEVAAAAFQAQATAFEGVGDIYAPYYRQVDAVSFFSLPQGEREKLVGGIPKEDVIAAFDYYIRNFNHGRRFFLAGHSQGSNLLLRLLSEYMKENPEVYGRMIAAYVIGCAVTDGYMRENPHLRFAEGAADTGVIISYSTEAPEVRQRNPVAAPGANVINPISWTRGETPATAEESAGSYLPDKEGKFVQVEKYADARIDKSRGVIVCSTADVDSLAPGGGVFGRGVFFLHDYSLYYFDLRKNAALRAGVF
jgi:hypothetical protein